MKRMLGHFALAATLGLVACGGTTDDGGWYPSNDENRVQRRAPRFPGDTTPVNTDVDLDPVDSAVPPNVVCQIPSGVDVPRSLTPGAQVNVRGQQGGTDFCMDDGAGAEVCGYVSVLEARYRAVTNCKRDALLKLREHGIEYFGGDEEWVVARRDLLDGFWAEEPEFVHGDLYKLDSEVANLMVGTAKYKAATPFCFNKAQGAPVLESQTRVLSQISDSALLRLRDVNGTLDTLRQGLRVKMRNSVVEIKVAISEGAAIKPAASCVFTRR